jgi:hypothetical protein
LIEKEKTDNMQKIKNIHAAMLLRCISMKAILFFLGKPGRHS